MVIYIENKYSVYYVHRWGVKVLSKLSEARVQNHYKENGFAEPLNSQSEQ